MSQRQNIQQSSSEALSEIIVETSNENEHLLQRIEQLEAASELNGLSKMRKILNVVVSRLDEKGIFIGEELNRVVLETVH